VQKYSYTKKKRQAVGNQMKTSLLLHIRTFPLLNLMDEVNFEPLLSNSKIRKSSYSYE